MNKKYLHHTHTPYPIFYYLRDVIPDRQFLARRVREKHKYANIQLITINYIFYENWYSKRN